jgi:hypothetical protein
MKLGGFKIGKTKAGNAKEIALSGSNAATQIAELEEQLNGRTNNLKQTEEQLKKLSGKGKHRKETDEIIAKPHGPIGELTLEPEENLVDLAAPVAEVPGVIPEAGAEKIKVVEVQVGAVAPPPAKEAKAESMGDSFNNLFKQDEEEENPLASLIHSLPDVDVHELIEDLNELKGIIKDWQKK